MLLEKLKKLKIKIIMEKCQMLRRKNLSLSNLLLFESETIFSRKIISGRKNELWLWIHAWQLSGNLWFTDW